MFSTFKSLILYIKHGKYTTGSFTTMILTLTDKRLPNEHFSIVASQSISFCILKRLWLIKLSGQEYFPALFKVVVLMQQTIRFIASTTICIRKEDYFVNFKLEQLRFSASHLTWIICGNNLVRPPVIVEIASGGCPRFPMNLRTFEGEARTKSDAIYEFVLRKSNQTANSSV